MTAIEAAATKAAGKHIPSAPEPTRDVKPEAPARKDDGEKAAGVATSEHGPDKYGAGGGQTGTGSGENPPGVSAGNDDDDRLTWSDETGARGRVISVTIGDSKGSTTREAVLAPHASAEEVDKAKQRLRAAILR